MFCEYSDIFGNPNEGVHSYRLFNVAIVDVGLTILVAYLLSIWVGGNKFGLILIIFFILGIFFHRLFCVRTTIDKLLFEKKN